jgi:N-methylhydantoinase B/oxoprolinase/acetone carboxylase alpha subunit
MSPRATTIEEEGVYIDNFKLRGSKDASARMRPSLLLTGARYPVRNVAAERRRPEARRSPPMKRALRN